MFPKTLVVGFLVVALAYIYIKLKNNYVHPQDEIEYNIILAWDTYIIPPTKQFKKIAVGTNANLDLIVPGIPLLVALQAVPGRRVDHSAIGSVDDLQETFAHFFSKGSAAERAVTDADTFKKIINATESLEKKEYYIGGNAGLMATKITKLFPDAQVQLVGPVGPLLKDLLPKEISIPKGSYIPEDEVHLIMEYGVGETWGDANTPTATRFIISHDVSNARMSHLELFFNSLIDFKPELVILSGLHLLEAESKDFFLERVKVVKEGFRKLDPTLPVHLELASMANGDFVKAVIDQVLPEITSLGLNEQEISFSAHVAGGPHGDDYHTRTGQPEIYKIGDMVLWLLNSYGYSKDRPDSKLTRVHFHSLTYHILGTIVGSWRNMESSVAAGTRMAGRQACDIPALDPEYVELRIPKSFKLHSGDVDRQFDANNPVLSLEQGGIKLVFSPVLVCKDPLKTVGLGDAISATGLMYSEFDAKFPTR